MNSNITRYNVNYDLTKWQQKIQPRNSEESYYTLGRLTSTQRGEDQPNPINNTLVVTKVNGKGKTEFFCTVHEMVFEMHDKCPGCMGAIDNTPKSATVTPYNTP